MTAADQSGSSALIGGVAVVAVVVLLVVGTVLARRRGYSGLGGRTVVRCRRGHLFSTIHVPGASLKSVRLGWARLQWCPVGRHVSLVTPVKDQDLTDEQRAAALSNRDIPIP